jgi:signal transduction histidine kinase
MQLNEEKLREELTRIIQSDPKNYSKILDLSSRLAGLDPSNIRFTVDAGVIDRLGKELVGRKETAVSELVKNAYDADAKTVDLIFESSNEIGGSLKIVDDGVGMTRDEVINGFMRISSSEKVHNPKSKLYSRYRAGRKGIGRFSVQRLGQRLTIITQVFESKNAVKVTINWDDYKADKEIYEITNKIEEIPKLKDQGTILIIENLRDRWNTKDIEKIYRYVSALIQPYPLSKERQNVENTRSLKTADPGFKANLLKNENGILVTIADEQSMIFDYSLAVFEGYVDSEGNSFYSIDSDRLDIHEVEKLGADRNYPDSIYTKLKDVNFRAYYFMYLPEYIPTQQRSKINELAQHSGGIRLYRNGFRVLPYGEAFNDWLRFDESEKKRTLLPRHGNTNFFGFVEVSDPNGKMFEETSSREGLFENESFEQLRDFVYRSITAGVARIGYARDIKVTTSQKDWDKRYERPTDRLKYIKEEISKQTSEIEDELKQIDNYSKKTKEDLANELIDKTKALRGVVGKIDNLIEEQAKEDEEAFKETSILRVLASLGLSIGIFVHEIRHYLSTIQSSVNVLIKSFPENHEAHERLNRMREKVQLLRTYTSYFDKTVSDNVTRELVPQDIALVIVTFIKAISLDNRLDKINKVTIIEPQIIGEDLYTVPMHSSEWATILFNFYTNAIKAIKRARSNGTIFIKAGEENEKIYVEFYDNGDGIPEKNRDKIFESFFTTSSPAGHFVEEQDEILGTGLGLKIVKDIITAYRGTIQAIDPIDGFATCIRIELPKATEKEIEQL